MTWPKVPNLATTTERLPPASIAAYLAANGWQLESSAAPDASPIAATWTKGPDFEIAVPLRPDYLDFNRRMSEIIDTLSRSQDRDKAEVVADISSIACPLSPVLSAIAQRYFGNGTLAARNSDALDFRDVAVWNLKAALEDAFEAGRQPLSDRGR